MKNFIPLENLLGEFVSENHRGPSSCCCAVAKEGKTLYEGYFGYANREAGIKSNPDTLYRMFSMTKIVTCTAAMMLFEQGKFLLNEPISDYLPEFKDMSVCKTLDNGKMVIEKAKQPILIKHAFTMSCGIGYPSDGTPTSLALQKIISEFAGEGEFDLRTHLKAMATVPLAFEPGTRWLYGHGHDLIAGLIEVISGKSIGNFFHENIFDPLEMKNTDYRYHGGNEANMAVCYKTDDNTPKLTPSVGFLDANHQPDAIYEAGGAGLYSTLRDYLIFSQMLANGGVHKGERLI
ncbi:MAG: serine hydrolase, partial [Eubacteriales bacterium]|nr:serine hydrolase [Eubacteriales bacterium]